ncbi:MAG TPA: putative zinc-binding metallopeptidase, partial [Polyangiaceae bacterium]|nr:putative zinc-binding metallopeptidase [Polyangiaceae bacterium]
MKWFKCECGASVYFDNTGCLACGRSLGFAPELRQMLAFTLPSSQPGSVAESQPSATEAQPSSGAAEVPSNPAPPNPGMPVVATDAEGKKHRQCANTAEGVCNWLVREDDDCPLCVACRLNETIPDLSIAENRAKWARLEAAKRRLVFTLTRLQLEVVPKSEAPDHGLAFDFKADTPALKVFTGHDNGLITLNIDEADPVRREQARLSLNERYRTLLGHLRHESGHYYWDRLIRDDEPLLQEFRS